jgi:hypothetical protein
MSGNRLFATYLNDHLAGATVGVELARRIESQNRESEYGPVLTELAHEIEEDREALLGLMESLGIGKDRVKVAVSWAGEKLGRLKPNGRLISYSPLSRLEELELLGLGVEGKLSMWQALNRTVAVDGRVAGVDLQELIKRAQSQRRRIETQRLKAAAEALGDDA